MLGKITGVVDYIDTDHILVDNAGVGYIVYCSDDVLHSYKKGEEISLYLDTRINEEQIKLIGFKTLEEKQTYKILTSVQGVGAKMALNILGSLTPNEINTAIIANDKTAFTKISGVGPKLASRIINELQDKKAIKSSGLAVGNVSVGTAANNNILVDATTALVSLGFNRSNVHDVLSKIIIQEQDISLEELIKSGLGVLSG